MNVTADAGVVKHILKDGKGALPTLHSRCLVHYKGTVRETGSVFMDTRAEEGPITVVAGRDSVLQGAGLNLAVAKMRLGELARVEVQPAYGYGTQGSFSFPCVPPQSTLDYEVELIGFDDVDEDRAASGMLFEDRLEAAERRRLDGNALFQAGEFPDALGKYAMALSYMDQDFMFQLHGAHEAKANAVRLPVLLNMAACHLRLGDAGGAADSASQVLLTDPKNPKALFRRGKARRQSGQNVEAKQDLEAALKLTPRDSAVVKELQSLRQQMKEEKQAADGIFRGRFPKAEQRRNSPLLSAWRRLCKLARQWLERLAPRYWREEKAHLT